MLSIIFGSGIFNLFDYMGSILIVWVRLCCTLMDQYLVFYLNYILFNNFNFLYMIILYLYLFMFFFLIILILREITNLISLAGILLDFGLLGSTFIIYLTSFRFYSIFITTATDFCTWLFYLTERFILFSGNTWCCLS